MKLEKFLNKFVGMAQHVDICRDKDGKTLAVGDSLDIQRSKKWDSIKKRQVVNIMTIDYDEDYRYPDIEILCDKSVLVIYVL